LPDSPPVVVTHAGERSWISVESPNGSGGVPLKVGGTTFAWLGIQVLCHTDPATRWLVIDSSKLWVVASMDREPIFRFEYRPDVDSGPTHRMHVHAHRGALTHLMTWTGHKVPHDISALQIPTGGAYFRPGLEDVIQFLIQDCGFDGMAGWQIAVREARARFRPRQVAEAVRATPRLAAEALVALGYIVQTPFGGHVADEHGALTDW
jgi:hypothetical protein